MEKERVILIIEDNKIQRENLTMILEERFLVETAGSYQEGVERIFQAQPPIEAVLLDLNLPDSEPDQSVRRFINQFPGLPVIVVTEEEDPQLAANVIKQGARDFVHKNGIYYEDQYFLNALSKIFMESREKPVSKNDDYFFPKSEEFSGIYQKAAMALKESFPLYIYGETGVGKSYLVEYLHKQIMPDTTLVECDCGGFSESLLESELFGYKKGAFSEAKTDRKGLIETAHEGVLFLDEITSASLKVQQKLLRVLETGKLRRLGDTVERQVKFSLISAGNKKIRDEIKAGRFKEDLMFRITDIEIEMIPLRRDRDLLNQFIKFFINYYNKKCDTFFVPSQELYADLRSRPWKGNIRELEKAIKRLIYFNHYGIKSDNTPQMEEEDSLSLKERLKKYERDLILEALNHFDWNVTRAAEYLIMPRPTLHSRIDSLGLKKEKEKEN